MVKVELLATIRAAQAQNGLRHNDYHRYRRFCTAKLQKLRHAAKFTYGRGTFEPKPITPELCQDPRLVLVLLFNAERAWSYAMQVRQDLSFKAGHKSRRHLLTRLRKAAKWAAALEQVVTEVGDIKTILEAQVYKGTMLGNLFLEESRWEDAQNAYLAAQAVLQRLLEVDDSLEVLAIQQKLSQIEPMIRFCQHQLGQVVDPQELIQLKFSNTPEAELLNAQIEGLLAESRNARVKGGLELKIKDKTYTVKNEKARQALQKAEEIFAVLDGAGNKLDLYTEAFGLYDEACKCIKKDKDDAEAAGDLGEAAVWGKLLEAVESAKLAKLVERNYELAKLAEAKFEDETLLAIRQGRPKGKPQEIVKIYDTILASVRDVGDQGKEAEVRGKRGYWMAVHHLYEGRPLESYALLQRCLEFGNDSDSVRSLQLRLRAHLAAKPSTISKGTSEAEVPQLAPISAKPVFYDIALDHVEYPNLKDRVQSKGLFSKLTGWFGR